MKSRLITYSKFLLCLVFLCASCNTEEETQIIRLGHGLDTSHSVHKAMVYMAEKVEEKSGGSLSIKIYPNQQLGSERECLELLQIGSLGMTKVSAATMENFAPEFKVLNLPYLFRDSAHRYKVLEGAIGQTLLKSSESKRLIGLTFYDSGTRNFYADIPIETPDDLKGLKLRVMPSQSAINMVKHLGGSPTPISWGELYTALQQGIVDGAENNLPSYYLNNHYEVCQYYSMDEHTAVPDELIISTIVWNKLNDQQKQWLKEAAEESSIYQKKLWQESEQEALEGMKEAGVKIIHPDKEKFRELVGPMYEEFRRDPLMKRTIEAIQAVE
ncbi:TRAP transporter substrate-binding protein [Antarcticibacterium sp. 1MA-6-2]|uniref:TRAP transporter substrate-binding protein n=1 Tax=Antarcticibacterium sp. 1MA-6-2 TaxID=2908210 RepID=UPI001F3A7B69|nr:TRAP transporter substrate-binding protein [Antarcticibacterium sp. 1MA-6-2]UJH89895.1 TRAP transporter substrate-binding protein [Antarcticibacterium sp. 1MA-6-2]